MHSDSLLKAFHTQPDMIYVQGHRGARGVLPENTLESFEYALSLGIQSLELDVLMTQDNILVATHNSALHPDTTRHLSGEWVNEDAFQIRNLTLQELQDFNVGACRPESNYQRRFKDQQSLNFAAIPALTDVFQLLLLPENISAWLNIEIKSDPTKFYQTAPVALVVQQLTDAIEAFGLQKRVVVQSFDWNLCLEMQRVAPHIATSYLTSVGPEDEYGNNNIYPDSVWMGPLANAHLHSSLPEVIVNAGGKMWAPYFDNLTSEEMTMARQLGLITYAWTVNELDDVDAMIALGVDGIITDYPLMVLEHLRAQGKAAALIA